MSLVIDIRAGNGAGKSWTIRQVMSAFEQKSVSKLSSGVTVNVFDKFVTIGSYKSPTGGCDTISKPSIAFDAVLECAAHTNVIYEGALVGTTYQPTMDLISKLSSIGVKYVPVCLSTTFEQCVSNINKRRADRGKGPLEKLVNIDISYRKHLSSAKKMHAAGMNPYWVDSERAVEIIIKELENA